MKVLKSKPKSVFDQTLIDSKNRVYDFKYQLYDYKDGSNRFIWRCRTCQAKIHADGSYIHDEFIVNNDKTREVLNAHSCELEFIDQVHRS